MPKSFHRNAISIKILLPPEIDVDIDGSFNLHCIYLANELGQHSCRLPRKHQVGLPSSMADCKMSYIPCSSPVTY